MFDRSSTSCNYSSFNSDVSVYAVLRSLETGQVKERMLSHEAGLARGLLLGFFTRPAKKLARA